MNWLTATTFGDELCRHTAYYQSGMGCVPLMPAPATTDHPYLTAAHATVVADQRLTTITVDLRRRTHAPDPEAIHQEFELDPGYDRGFYVHDGRLIVFSKPEREGDCLVMDRRREASAFRVWKLSSWCGYFIFYNSTRNVATAVCPPMDCVVNRCGVMRNGDRFHYFLNTELPEQGKRLTQSFTLRSYRPSNKRLWWAEGLLDAARYNRNQVRYPVLTMPRRSYAVGTRPQIMMIAKTAACKSYVVKDACTGKVVEQGEVDFAPPVTRLRLAPVERSGVYVFKCGRYSTAFVVRPRKPGADILFLCSTNQWRAYSANGHYCGGHTKFPFQSTCGAVVMQSPHPGHEGEFGASQRPDYLPPMWHTGEVGILQALRRYSRQSGREIDICGEEDIHFGKINVARYKLVIVDSHSEYYTQPQLDALQAYIDNGGGVLFLGADNFGRKVTYQPDTYEMELQRIDLLHGYDSIGLPQSEKYMQPFGGTCNGVYPHGGNGEIVVTDDSHPVTAGFNNGDVVTATFWEADRFSADWHVVAAVRGTNTWSRNRDGSATSAAIAFHRSRRLAAFGPMGVTCTLAGKYGNRKNLQQLFERTITHLLS
ncbi:MAG TPA: hypothetical protein DIT01_14630 [Lentisphaeria bacterium]|nr:hypothetical protein [Lentisphaeria bacterium]